MASENYSICIISRNIEKLDFETKLYDIKLKYESIKTLHINANFGEIIKLGGSNVEILKPLEKLEVRVLVLNMAIFGMENIDKVV